MVLVGPSLYLISLTKCGVIGGPPLARADKARRVLMGVRAIPWPKEACANPKSRLVLRFKTRVLPSFGRSIPVVVSRPKASIALLKLRFPIREATKAAPVLSDLLSTVCIERPEP